MLADEALTVDKPSTVKNATNPTACILRLLIPRHILLTIIALVPLIAHLFIDTVPDGSSFCLSASSCKLCIQGLYYVLFTEVNFQYCCNNYTQLAV